ncbi:DoxX family protein [Devosia sp.]|uniref:DoxX family protein n=1 Tax=Devosia sp. TaxID=1871048 RepID=UPI001B29F58F|nr:DoxX family protein [Devosia sp.]MBO9588531.1 DoxX family protein [Devosia sp.]
MISTIAILAARLIFGGAFLVALVMKFMGIGDTAAAIASIGFPFPLFFAWAAAFFELGLVLAFFTGALFTEAAALAAVYVLFLGFAFYGPASWPGNPMQMGLFINHLTFVAGLLFAAVHGPGRTLVLARAVPWLAVRRS